MIDEINPDLKFICSKGSGAAILSLISVIPLSKWFWCALSTVYGFPVYYCRGGCMKDLFWLQTPLMQYVTSSYERLGAVFRASDYLGQIGTFWNLVQICECAATILWKASVTHLHKLYTVQKFAKKLCDTISYNAVSSISLLCKLHIQDLQSRAEFLPSLIIYCQALQWIALKLYNNMCCSF